MGREVGGLVGASVYVVLNSNCGLFDRVISWHLEEVMIDADGNM